MINHFRTSESINSNTGQLAPIWGNIDTWADRNEHWVAEANAGRQRGRRERAKEPLILCGNGVSLRVDKGTLMVRDGFTHWPQERVEHRLFKGAANLPSRIVMLDGSGSLTFDVITWLSEQSIPLIKLDYQGEVVSVIGGANFASLPEKVQWQVETRGDPERRLVFCRELIGAKLRQSLETLAIAIPDSTARQMAIARAEAAIYRLDQGEIQSVDEVRMIEANAAAAYFKAWQGIPLMWRSRWKHPVPETWFAVGRRNTPGRGRSLSNRNARHPMNAILNYAYGMMASQVQIQAIAEGYDPRRGIMHHDREDRDALAFVFDMIEPRRPVVDAAVLRFVQRTPITGADFVVRSDGVCRLAPQLARSVATAVTLPRLN